LGAVPVGVIGIEWLSAVAVRVRSPVGVIYIRNGKKQKAEWKREQGKTICQLGLKPGSIVHQHHNCFTYSHGNKQAQVVLVITPTQNIKRKKLPELPLPS
jgi:hypothetical protein